MLGWHRYRNISRNRYQHKLHSRYKYVIGDIKLQFRHLVIEISRDDITQCQPYHKIRFGTQHQPYHLISIDIKFHWSPNIPGLVNNDFRSKYSFCFSFLCFSRFNWTLNVNTQNKCVINKINKKESSNLIDVFS